MLNTTTTPIRAEGSRMTLLWLPSFLVASVMLSFLAISFTRHVRRVRRKKQIVWDYMSLHLNIKRCRISANLCNTYSIPLRQLASSVKMQIMEEPVPRPPIQTSCGAVPMRARMKQKGIFGDTLSPDEDEYVVDSLDLDDSVRIRVDLLCDRCREHLAMKPIFYISEDSQSVVLGDVTGSQIFRDNSTDSKTQGTSRNVLASRQSNLSSRNHSLASEDETEFTRRVPLIQRVPTVTVTDMSDVEMDSFHHDTVSLDSLGLSSESIPQYGKPKGKTKVLLSADDATECYDGSRDPEDYDRQQPLIVTSDHSQDNVKTNKHREFLKFFSKRKRRKFSKKSKKPVLTKQDRIVPRSEAVSKSMDDMIRKEVTERKDGNVIERRKLFAGQKTTDHSTVIDVDNEVKPEASDRRQNVIKMHSVDGNTQCNQTLNACNTYLCNKRRVYRGLIQGKFQTRSHDNEGLDTRPLSPENVTLNQYGGRRQESLDSCLKDSFLKLPTISSHADGKNQRSKSALSLASICDVPKPSRVRDEVEVEKDKGCSG